MKHYFLEGCKDGIPICIGYFFVAFGIGIYARQVGLSSAIAVIISLTNLTSAGQVAGIGVIASLGSYFELFLTQLIINCRYSLMAISLGQKLDSSFTFMHRLIAGFGITDEIFGVAVSKNDPLVPSYMYGMILVSAFGWVGGTAIGAIMGDILPVTLTNALGILLYAMFIAIIIPQAKESLKNLTAIILAALISICLYYYLPNISSGFRIIIAAIIAAALLSIKEAY